MGSLSFLHLPSATEGTALHGCLRLCAPWGGKLGQDCPPLVARQLGPKQWAVITKVSLQSRKEASSGPGSSRAAERKALPSSASRGSCVWAESGHGATSHTEVRPLRPCSGPYRSPCGHLAAAATGLCGQNCFTQKPVSNSRAGIGLTGHLLLYYC